MDYRFTVNATAFDFFKMIMKNTYSSPLGICNLVLTVSAIFATVKLYAGLGDIMRGIMVLLCLVFPVIQPIGVYMKAKGLAATMPQGFTIETRADGLLVTVGDRSEVVPYGRIQSINNTGDCLIVSLGGRHGYCLFNRVLGDKKAEFEEFLRSRTGK